MSRQPDADVSLDLEKLIARCERHIKVLKQLRANVASVENDLGIFGLRRIGRLSNSSRVLLALLLKREIVYSETMYAALYGHRAEADKPSPEVIDQFVMRIRAALATLDIVLHTSRGGAGEDTGFYISPEGKAKLNAFINPDEKAVDKPSQSA